MTHTSKNSSYLRIAPLKGPSEPVFSVEVLNFTYTESTLQKSCDFGFEKNRDKLS